ncbi:hypothetical protein Klosneuvirus_3_252 [Klosneuvirus KNV1]|uniref:Uncharacterized protein n=1 Tax=Klosneuvirus KNV1 TaxID=1977640 RepID=A0A1V0SK70_9VIRU|nr:hypothetical protein Klosneuvirus_3_252 [Klosneuvirus KNV1]
MNIDEFNNLRKKIQDEQFKDFTGNLTKSMTKMEYVCLFLNTFLGKYLTVTETETSNEFADISHELIDCISLLGPEISFFHKLVDYEYTDNYIDKLIDVYHQTKNLNRCQLGYNIMRCLEASKQIVITS